MNDPMHTGTTRTHYLDATGLICPEPVMLLHKAVRQADSGEFIDVLATDPATTRDVPNFCRHLGHELCVCETVIDRKLKEPLPTNLANADIYHYVIQKK